MIYFDRSTRDRRFARAIIIIAATAVCLFVVALSSASAKVAIGIARAQQAGARAATRPAASPHLLNLAKVNVASFSPDGQILMTVAEADHQVHFWSVRN